METYHGHVKTPHDAIILFEACRLGLLPRVQRRLSEKERQNIKSGSVFVWDEREAGMRRWTDGKSWSASRVSGSFLTYREMEGKRGGGNAFATPMTSYGRKSPNGDSDSDHGIDLGDGPDGYRYKPDGLMKQSFSITTATHQKLHLISYYARSHPSSVNLLTPSTDPSLKHIQPARGMYPESTVHEQQNVPNVSRPIMNQAPFNHYSSSPIPPQYRVTSATHPHSYSQQVPALSPYNNSYITPTHTPPGNPAAIAPHYSQPQPQLPPVPVSNGSGTPLTYDRSNFGPHGSQMVHVDASPQPSSHAPSMPSPLMHLRASQQSSPRMGQDIQLHRQTSNPPPLESSCSIRYGSPSSSSHTSARTPPRTADGWEINPIRASPEGSTFYLVNSEASPGRTKMLDVQDIPSDKIRAQDDINTLRKLDKSFVL